MCRLYIDLLNRAIVHVCKLRPLQAKTLLASNRVDHGFRQKTVAFVFSNENEQALAGSESG